MSREQAAASTPPRTSLRPVLWASAFVLIGLIIFQAGRSTASSRDAALALPLGMRAADVVSRVGDYSVLSFNAGSDDVTVVLDGRGEELFAYRIKNQKEVALVARESLTEVFSKARQIGPRRN